MIGRDAAKAGGTEDLIGPFVELQARLARVIGGNADINLAHPDHLLGFGADGGFMGRLVPPTDIADAHGQIARAPAFRLHGHAFSPSGVRNSAAVSISTRCPSLRAASISSSSTGSGSTSSAKASRAMMSKLAWRDRKSTRLNS